MISKYCIKCRYCGIEIFCSVSNIENYVKWQECKYCGYNKFEARKLELVDYYKGDPIIENKVPEMKVELEEKSWF